MMTFIANHEAVVHEKNLGPDSAAIVQKMTRFDPIDTWKRRGSPRKGPRKRCVSQGLMGLAR